MRKLLPLLFILGVSNLSAQDPAYYHTYSHPFYSNPALSGFVLSQQLNTSFILSQPQLYLQEPVSFYTAYAGLEMPVENINSGVGFRIAKDVVTSGIRTTTTSLSFSSGLKLGDIVELRAGIDVQSHSMRIDHWKYRPQMRGHYTYGAGLPNLGRGRGYETFFSLDAGIIGIIANKVVLGVASRHINQPHVVDGKYLPRSYLAHGGVFLPFQEEEDGWMLFPNFSYRREAGNSQQVNANLQISKSIFMAGIGYTHLESYADLTNFSMGVVAGRFKAAYSYNTAMLIYLSDSNWPDRQFWATHEFTLNIIFGKYKDKAASEATKSRLRRSF